MSLDTADSHIPSADGSFPARRGNRVRTLVDGEPIFRRIGEAVDAARHSVWLTVAFYSPTFRFPDGRGGLFDALDRAVARGLDVRVLLWRPSSESYGYDRTFRGSPKDRELLAARNARFKIRWDRLPGRYCHHQKSWIIDAGTESETAFVGGANLSIDTLKRHDLYVEVTGPCATDVHHNFVERWNAASERHEPDGAWNANASDTLAPPTRQSLEAGTTTVQIQRMLLPRESSILEQYERAIDAAQRTIYIENQAIPVPQVADRLVGALERGVDVVLLVPAEAEAHVVAARCDPDEQGPFDSLRAMGGFPNFLLAGIPEAGADRRQPKYVHAKIMLVDDVWATIGSCNLHRFSLYGHSEMNASIWDEAIVRDLRCRLFRSHLGRDMSGLDDRAALRLYRQVAQAGGRGSAFALEPAKYALT